jgi:predicted RNA binding protein YcfA (HicA-like mRNA interferase family)
MARILARLVQKTRRFRLSMCGRRGTFGMLPAMKAGDVIRVLERNGWRLVATRGSHRQFKHPTHSGRVTVAGKPSDDVAAGTLNSILKQAGLK